ncbi:hypothetical protein HAX54_031134, partial [Datura stramonium]|nr:hypothetical protein [Datura stramonium]
GKNQHASNNENDDVVRDEVDERNVENIVPGNHHQPQRARGQRGVKKVNVVDNASRQEEHGLDFEEES